MAPSSTSLPRDSRPLRVAIDRTLAPSVSEVSYALRTLLRTAGYASELRWSDDAAESDVYYGNEPSPRAAVRIPAVGWSFASASVREPSATERVGRARYLVFDGEAAVAARHGESDLHFARDIVFAAFWFLTGAREATYPRDQRDNLSLDASVIVRDDLLSDPLVSRYATALREHFSALGIASLRPAWASNGHLAAFSFTHDVDYPQIIRWIEVPRLLASRGIGGISSAIGVATGANHFWTFDEWVQFERCHGARPTFYFMARQGSLLQYALGTPDDFYDVRTPAFQRLFGELKDAGCEIGLHASYLAHTSAEMLRTERERIEVAAGVRVSGNRHHYWHLDPADPNETLRRHEQAGLRYDSSLGLEFYPGFRRGICHPFRVFHPGERRELRVVQLPPAWMDDHYDRRLVRNGIADPDASAKAILDAARATGGIAIVDYHSRGMNADFYPRYGPWLRDFAERTFDSTLAFRTPSEILDEHLAFESALDEASITAIADGAIPTTVSSIGAASGIAGAGSAPPLQTPLEIRPLTAHDVRDVSQLHYDLFGDPETHGHSVATLGTPFLAGAFYTLNLDNPHFFCDVAHADGKVVGFSVYSTSRNEVFRHLVRRHAIRLALAGARTVLGHPPAFGAFLSNARYIGGESLPLLDGVPGWWIVAGVHSDYRTPEFERRIGGRIAAQMFDRMEERMRAVGCPAWYGVVRPENAPINIFLQRRGATLAGTANAQGMAMRYYVKRFDQAVT